MTDPNITGEGNAGGSQLNPAVPAPAVGNGAVAAPATAEALTLEELNKLTGKQFPTKESALKSITDTFSFVGKKKDDAVAEAKAQLAQANNTEHLASELASIRKDMFYKDNPAYAPYRTLIDKLGGNPSEVVNSAEFKEVFTKASGFDQAQKLKTVLDSNPRLASSKDRISKAKEAQLKGELRGEALAQEAVGALLEALES